MTLLKMTTEICFHTNSNILRSFAFHLADLKKNFTKEVDSTYEAGRDLTK